MASANNYLDLGFYHKKRTDHRLSSFMPSEYIEIDTHFCANLLTGYVSADFRFDALSFFRLPFSQYYYSATIDHEYLSTASKITMSGLL